ncbi:MAG TPA: hypothetical protein VKV34_08485, partial [Thermoleophilia bacterium]|nr:hypothetical protein [Thermoleophilia bacterium]
MTGIRFDERRTAHPTLPDCSAWFLSGINRAAHGRVLLLDVELTGPRPARRSSRSSGTSAPC